MYVLSVFEFDNSLPFSTTSSSVEIKSNKSAIDNEKFVQSEIEEMVKKGCVQEVI